jgi:hypothetical protein
MTDALCFEAIELVAACWTLHDGCKERRDKQQELIPCGCKQRREKQQGLAINYMQTKA